MPEIPRVVLHNSKTDHFAERLTQHLPDADFRECHTYADLPELLNTFRPQIVYTVRFDGTPAFPRSALFADDGPSWIANGGVGTDHFGMWDPASVTVTNTAGVAADMIAEYVIGGFLHFTLDVPGLLQDKANRDWNARKMAPLKGKTILIAGLGHTGRALAARAKAFGMTVLGTRARPVPMDNVDEVCAASDLPRLLPRADFVAICTPLIPETTGLIGKDEFKAMKPGAVLADVSRGGVVVEEALVEALMTGRLAGAVLDVFETEPLPADNTLWTQERVLLSPHCSSVFEGWEMASFDLFITNLDRWIAGESLTNVVDPKRGY